MAVESNQDEHRDLTDAELQEAVDTGIDAANENILNEVRSGRFGKGDLVDQMIKKAADEMSQEIWPALRNIHPTPEDMERVKRMLEGTSLNSNEFGTQETHLKGEEFVGRFAGKAWITADQDDGAFLSNMNYDDFHAKYREYRDKAADPNFKGAYPERTQFAIDELFPEDWRESQIEYEITVKAKRITPASPQT